MKQFEAKVYEMADKGLSEEEKQIVESIGEENADYCAAAILQHRYPDKEVIYHEDERKFEVDGEKMEIEFDMIQEDAIEENEDGSWISGVVLTLEMLFELGDPAK